MRLLALILLTFISFDSLANAGDTGLFGFFGAVELFFNDIIYFFTDVIPRKITEFIFWVKLYIAYTKFYLMIETLRFSYEIALSFIEQMNINEVIDVAVSNLPPDLRKAAVEMRVFDALSLLIEALITRFVYSVVTS